MGKEKSTRTLQTNQDMAFKKIISLMLTFLLVQSKLKLSTPSVSFVRAIYEIYQEHISMAQEIKITILKYTNEGNFATQDLTQKFCMEQSKLFFKKTWIREKRLHRSGSNRNTLYSPKHEVVVKTAPDFSKDDQMKKILEAEAKFFDTDKVRIIIGDDTSIFLDYLDSTSTNKFARKARYLNILLFSSENTDIEDVKKILLLMWDRFKILNVIAQIPRSKQAGTHIIIYKPFYITGNGYGQIQVYDFPSARPKTNHLLFNNMVNLNGYPLKVSIFVRKPTAIKKLHSPMIGTKIYRNIPKTSTFYGVDGVTISELSRIMNFTIKLYNNRNYSYYGKMDNERASEGLRQIISREADIQANSRFVQFYETSNYEYTNCFLSSDKICIVVPKAERIPKWLATLNLFRGWLGVSSVIILIPSTFLNKILQNGNISYVQSLLEMYSVLIGQSQTSVFRKNLSRRIFLLSFLIYALIISTLFSGQLIYSFAVTTYYANIKTLEEFDKRGDYIRTSINYFETSPSDLYQRLSKKVIPIVNTNLTPIELVAKFRGAGLERMRDAKLFLQTKFSDPDGKPLMHIIPECPQQFFLGYVLPMGSPYLKRISKILLTFHEAGLVNKWYEDVADAIVLKYRIRWQRRGLVSSSDESKYHNFKLDDIRSVFYLLIGGYVISTVVFIFEIFFYSVRY